MAKNKEDRKAQREADAEEIANIQASMRMNLDDAFMSVINKKAGIPNTKTASSQGSGLIDKRSDQQYLAGKKIAAEHMDWDDMLARLGKHPAQSEGRVTPGANYNPSANTISIALANKAMDNFQPVVAELSRFKFSSATEKRNEQMETLVEAVREAMQKVAIKEVANNTKRFYDNALKFTQTERDSKIVGLKVTYRVASGAANVSVMAEGSFYGDEIVCLEQDGSNATAYVARQNGNEFQDITENFKLSLDMIK